jgi:hypothetical protein
MRPPYRHAKIESCLFFRDTLPTQYAHNIFRQFPVVEHILVADLPQFFSGHAALLH